MRKRKNSNYATPTETNITSISTRSKSTTPKESSNDLKQKLDNSSMLVDTDTNYFIKKFKIDDCYISLENYTDDMIVQYQSSLKKDNSKLPIVSKAVEATNLNFQAPVTTRTNSGLSKLAEKSKLLEETKHTDSITAEATGTKKTTLLKITNSKATATSGISFQAVKPSNAKADLDISYDSDSSILPDLDI